VVESLQKFCPAISADFSRCPADGDVGGQQA
jgi:hypothetical protein